MDEMAPFHKVQVRNHFTPWVSEETKALMQSRDDARTKAVQSSQEEDWKSYRRLRNKCSTEVVRDRNKYNADRYESCENNNDVKGLYQHVKNQMGWKKSGPPSAFRLDNGIEKKPQMLANILSKHYQEKIKQLNDKLPAINEDPMHVLKAALVRWGEKTKEIKTFKIQPVAISHTLNLIKKN